MPKEVSRSARIYKAKNLLAIHLWLAQRLRKARQAGSITTSLTYRANLLVNARVLRSKLVPHTNRVEA